MNRTTAPIAVDASEAGALFGMSKRSWERMDKAGLVPAPRKLSAQMIRWDVAELRAWSANGMPPRKAKKTKKARS